MDYWGHFITAAALLQHLRPLYPKLTLGSLAARANSNLDRSRRASFHACFITYTFAAPLPPTPSHPVRHPHLVAIRTRARHTFLGLGRLDYASRITSRGHQDSSSDHRQHCIARDRSSTSCRSAESSEDDDGGHNGDGG